MAEKKEEEWPEINSQEAEVRTGIEVSPNDNVLSPSSRGNAAFRERHHMGGKRDSTESVKFITGTDSK